MLMYFNTETLVAATVGTKNVLCAVGRRCCSCSVYKEKTVRSCLTTKDTVKKKKKDSCFFSKLAVFYESANLSMKVLNQNFQHPTTVLPMNTVTG